MSSFCPLYSEVRSPPDRKPKVIVAKSLALAGSPGLCAIVPPSLSHQGVLLFETDCFWNLTWLTICLDEASVR